MRGGRPAWMKAEAASEDWFARSWGTVAQIPKSEPEDVESGGRWRNGTENGESRTRFDNCAAARPLLAALWPPGSRRAKGSDARVFRATDPVAVVRGCPGWDRAVSGRDVDAGWGGCLSDTARGGELVTRPAGGLFAGRTVARLGALGRFGVGCVIE